MSDEPEYLICLSVRICEREARGGRDCGGSVISAIGGSSVVLNNGTIAGGATCTITATVTASNTGAYVNTLPTGSVTSTQTQNMSAATATLNVTQLAAPGVTKTFEPPLRSRFQRCRTMRSRVLRSHSQSPR
jgi:hypothetical protein